MKYRLLILLALFLPAALPAQELQGRVTVISSQVSSTTDKKVFNTLQTALNNFINNRKWTGDSYNAQEKIRCSFLLNIDEAKGENVYKATLTVQAARPIYGTSYESPLINYQDGDLLFRYQEFSPIEFNENRIQGSDPLAANLPAVLAYYVHLILGMDYDSFAPRGGDPYFQKALFIANNAPESRDITGWKPFDGLRNRYRLAENLTDSRYTLVHDALYAYYRSGFDQLATNEEEGRNGVLSALNYLNTVNTENPNSAFIQFFFGGKSTELARLFSKSTGDTRSRAREFLTRLDGPHASVYKELN